MRILVTNDDGIYSPGISALAEVASRFGQVIVIAPDCEQSAMSHAITVQRPFRYHRVKLGSLEAYRVNGTPADCVALGFYHWGEPDLVLSGINLGSNIGHDIWHSGTVAAAKQSAFFRVRGIAFSQAMNGEEPSFESAKPHIEQVIRLLLEGEQPLLVNVNLPKGEPQGLLWTHQSVRSYSGKIIEGKDPSGRQNFWFADIPLSHPDPGSDRWAVENDLISLTPLRLDLTDESSLRRMKKET